MTDKCSPPCAICKLNRLLDIPCRWFRHKWRYRPSNMKRLREEQQDINAIAAGTDRDDFYMDIMHDLLSEVPPDKENEDD